MTEAPLTAEQKADFDDIYTRPDPRAYFRTLGKLDYQVPAHAAPLVAEGVERAGGGRRAVLDLCCSYGTNAALLRTSADLPALQRRYCDPVLDGLSPDALAAADAAFFAARARRPGVRVLGVDSSAPAVAYGVRSGLLAAGFAEDLETDDPSPGLAEALAGVGTIVCTGGVGYVGVPTFRRLLAHAPADVSLVLLVLRVFDVAAIAAVLAERGLVVRRLPGSVRQRRFADAAEQEAAVADVRARGLDPAGKESAGWFHADRYLAGPPD